MGLPREPALLYKTSFPLYKEFTVWRYCKCIHVGCVSDSPFDSEQSKYKKNVLVVQCHKYSSNKLKLLLQHGQYTSYMYNLCSTANPFHCHHHCHYFTMLTFPIGFKTQIKASISCHRIDFILHFIIWHHNNEWTNACACCVGYDASSFLFLKK